MGIDMHMVIQERAGVPEMGTPEWDNTEHVWRDAQILEMKRDATFFSYLAGVGSEAPEMGVAFRGLPKPAGNCKWGFSPEQEVDEMHHIRLDQLILYLKAIKSFLSESSDLLSAFALYRVNASRYYISALVGMLKGWADLRQTEYEDVRISFFFSS